tara:strand:+ start:1481 stop:2152 length:672 start_codon:yes stop_codon:yes gene_type:complete
MKTVKPSVILGPLNDVEQKNAPSCIHFSGHVGILQSGPRIAVVGSRKVSIDGAKRAKRLVIELVKNDCVIISGLAMGVDTIAHRVSMQTGGKTVAVLGTPLDIATPVGNRDLQNEIMNDHLAISQFGIGTTISKRNFPARNRTMALVCQASVIVEAGDSSGTLSQGWEAIRLGRPLFIMKSLFDSSLKWPSMMREYGAIVLESSEQILDCVPTESYLETADAF